MSEVKSYDLAESRDERRGDAGRGIEDLEQPRSQVRTGEPCDKHPDCKIYLGHRGKCRGRVLGNPIRGVTRAWLLEARRQASAKAHRLAPSVEPDPVVETALAEMERVASARRDVHRRIGRSGITGDELALLESLDLPARCRDQQYLIPRPAVSPRPRKVVNPEEREAFLAAQRRTAMNSGFQGYTAHRGKTKREKRRGKKMRQLARLIRVVEIRQRLSRPVSADVASRIEYLRARVDAISIREVMECANAMGLPSGAAIRAALRETKEGLR